MVLQANQYFYILHIHQAEKGLERDLLAMHEVDGQVEGFFTISQTDIKPFDHTNDQVLLIMTARNLFWSQLRKLLPIITATWLPAIFLIIVLGIIGLLTDTSGTSFMRDPAPTMGVSAYIGLVSNIGVLLWSSTAAICIFSYALLRNSLENKDLKLFILFAGLITGYLLLDDFFLFHEQMSDRIPEAVIFAVYIIVVLCYLVRFRTKILRTEFSLLLLAGILFGLSLAVDVLHDMAIFMYLGNMRVFIEDGFKFLGIVTWFTYFARTCFLSLKEAGVLKRQPV